MTNASAVAFAWGGFVNFFGSSTTIVPHVGSHSPRCPRILFTMLGRYFLLPTHGYLCDDDASNGSGGCALYCSRDCALLLILLLLLPSKPTNCSAFIPTALCSTVSSVSKPVKRPTLHQPANKPHKKFSLSLSRRRAPRRKCGVRVAGVCRETCHPARLNCVLARLRPTTCLNIGARRRTDHTVLKKEEY